MSGGPGGVRELFPGRGRRLVTKWWFPVFCTGVGGVNFRCSTVERPGHTGRSAGEGQHGGWAGSSRGAAAVPCACIGAGSR